MENEKIIEILYKLLGYYITHALPNSIEDECMAVEIAISIIKKGAYT